MSRSIYSYSQDYRKKVFDVWYLNGRPDATKLRKLIPPTDEGVTPSVSVLRKWPIEGMWDIYADEMDVKVALVTDADLINQKAEMLRKHQANAARVAEKALAQIIKDGFDSSAAAVHAYFKSTEEQRKTAGFSDLLEKLEKMTNNEVEQQIINLLNRASENDQIINVDSKDVAGEEVEDSA